MEKQAVIKWAKTTGIAAVGGGIAGALTAAVDPSKYHFPHDLGSGKLFVYFFEGFGLTFGGMLLKSPLGQQVMGAYKDSQQQLQASKADLAAAKTELKAAGLPPPSSPAPKP